MRTFSRSASVSTLGQFRGSDGGIEEPLCSVKVNEKEVIYYDFHPRLPQRPRRIILGYKKSEYRHNGEKVEIDYDQDISREDRLVLLKKFKDIISLQFGEIVR